MELDLNEIAIFIKVVEAGSFTQAARQLGMPNSTVSAKVSDLEKRLKVSLIRRTTRKLFVTQEGRAFFDRCTKGLNEIKAAEDEISLGQKEPQGVLKITAPIEIGAVILPEIIERFKKDYPKVIFDIDLSDRTVDLISEGFDLAIRAGELKDSSLVAKKFGDVYFALFASPAYLKKNGTLSHPKDLKNHWCLHFSRLSSETWKLTSSKGVIEIPIKDSSRINELNTLKTLIINGVGVALLPTFLCNPEVMSGKLVRILKDWRTNVRPVHFVYSGNKNLSPKISAFINVATEMTQKKLYNFDL